MTDNNLNFQRAAKDGQPQFIREPLLDVKATLKSND